MFLLFLFLGVAGRLWIHIPNATPIIPLCFFASHYFSKKQSLILILSILILSDSFLVFYNHYSFLVSWIVFVYSAWIGVIFFSFISSQKPVFFVLSSSLFFWIWTNFGTWVGTHLYAHSWQGLWQCYEMGLPFLRDGITGSVVWMMILKIMLHGREHIHFLYLQKFFSCYLTNTTGFYFLESTRSGSTHTNTNTNTISHTPSSQ